MSSFKGRKDRGRNKKIPKFLKDKIEGKKTIRIKSRRLDSNAFCFGCNTKLDGWAGLGKSNPKEGSFSVCAYCKKLARFDKNLNLVPVSNKEENELRLLQPDFYEQLTFFRDISHGSKPPNIRNIMN